MFLSQHTQSIQKNNKDKCLIILRGLKAPYGVEGEGKINKCPKTKLIFLDVKKLFQVKIVKCEEVWGKIL